MAAMTCRYGSNDALAVVRSTASEITSQPPGLTMAARRRNTSSRSRRCISTMRACTRSNRPRRSAASGSQKSTSRAVRLGWWRESPTSNRRSRSAATTCPSGKWPASQAAMVPGPAPTSRHRASAGRSRAADRLALGALDGCAGLDRAAGVADAGGGRPAFRARVELHARLVDQREHRLQPGSRLADPAQYATAFAERAAQREHRRAGEIGGLPEGGVDLGVHPLHRGQPGELGCGHRPRPCLGRCRGRCARRGRSAVAEGGRASPVGVGEPPAQQRAAEPGTSAAAASSPVGVWFVVGVERPPDPRLLRRRWFSRGWDNPAALRGRPAGVGAAD